MTTPPVTAPASRPSRPARLAPWAIAVAHGALTALLAFRHEPWRDEVRALLIATRTPTWEAFRLMMSTEGHPMLWQLLLRGLHAMTATDLVLPALAWAIGVLAVAVMAFRAPWPSWLTGLFALGVFPLWEYSVVARPYGLAMALAFAYCALAPCRRERPWGPALLLALLAQTSIHGAVIAAALALAWALEEGDGWRRWAAPLGLVVLSLALCAWQVAPPADSLVAASRRSPTTGDLVRSVGRALVHPGERFPVLSLGGAPKLGGSADSWLGAARLATLLLLVAVVSLRRRPALIVALAGATVTLFVLFDTVYTGAARHQGQLYVLVVALAWLAMDRQPARATGRRLALAGLGVLFALHASRGVHAASRDWRHPYSAAATVGEWLEQEAPEAVVVPEPDFLLEAVSYRRALPIWLPRERRWGPSPRWTTAGRDTVTLAELLEDARRIRDERRTTVAIVLPEAVALRSGNDGAMTTGYGHTFRWTRDEVTALEREGGPPHTFGGALTDENFRVHLLRHSATTPSPPTAHR